MRDRKKQDTKSRPHIIYNLGKEKMYPSDYF